MKPNFILQITAVLFMFSLNSFTITNTADPPFEQEKCEVSVQNKVRFGFQRKMVDGTAFSKEISNTKSTNIKQLTKGMVDICIRSQGGCKWNFLANESNEEQNVSVEISGLEEVVKALKLSSNQLPASTDGFIKIAKDKGAKITDLGNGTLSIRKEDGRTKLTTVTIVDTKRKVILGSSVYGAGNQLKSKIICKYKGVFTQLQLHTVSLLVFEHDMGDKSGWMTEIIACY